MLGMSKLNFCVSPYQIQTKAAIHSMPLVLPGVIAVIAFLSHYISIPLSVIRFWRKSAGTGSTSSILPCDNFRVDDVWVKKFPKMLTESAFRVIDVNKDKVDDFIFGFATGKDCMLLSC
jgi:hypothetical protein